MFYYLFSFFEQNCGSSVVVANVLCLFAPAIWICIHENNKIAFAIVGNRFGLVAVLLINVRMSLPVSCWAGSRIVNKGKDVCFRLQLDLQPPSLQACHLNRDHSSMFSDVALSRRVPMLDPCFAADPTEPLPLPLPLPW